MRTRTKFFLVMASVVVLSLPVCYVNTMVDDKKEEELRSLCAPQAQKPWEKYSSNSTSGMFDDLVVCEQANKYAGSRTRWMNVWASASSFLLFIAAVPFAWSLLLARIRELGRAVRGLD